MSPYRKPVVAGHLHLNNPQQKIFYLRAVGSALFLILLLVFSKAARSQCIPPDLTFSSPVLISGTDGQVGAVYLFSNVTLGVDAQIEVLALNGGAALGEIDNTTQGYFDAWQPYVTAGANDTSSLDWKISFKVAGTNIDFLFPCLAVTAIDVDGDNAYLQEFIRAATPGAYAVDPFTWLSVTFDGVATTAISTLSNVPSIDTAARKAMFQMNFTDVSSMVYRNGAISTKGTPDTRHTCIYFKQFFDQMFFLPVHLISFHATPLNKGIQINWKATDENDVLSYTIQKSSNGRNWKNINTVNARNTGSGIQTYAVIDEDDAKGKVYYRLQYNNHKIITYSKIIFANSASVSKLIVNCSTIINSSDIPMQLTTGNKDVYEVCISTIDGRIINRRQAELQPGTNNIHLAVPATMSKGIYMLVVKTKQGETVFTKKMIYQ